MKEEIELQKLIIGELDVIEKSRKLLREPINGNFKREFSRLMPGEIRKILPGWRAEIDLKENCDFDFFPEDWKFSRDENDQTTPPMCYFMIAFYDWNKWQGEEYLTYLEYCTGAHDTSPHITFTCNSEFQDKTSLSDDEFYSSIKKLYVDNEDVFDREGFIFDDDDNYLYRPFKLNPKDISESWPKLTVQAVQPLLDAIRGVKGTYEIFNNWVMEKVKKRRRNR